MRRLPIIAALVLGLLLVVESAIRPRLAALDAYQYADVALNFAAGRGLTQSVLGYNAPRFPADGDWPVPFTSQPPLYPLLGALGVRLGAPPVAALAALAAAALVAGWFAAAWLARLIAGEQAATLTLLGLAACASSMQLSPRIWSEPLGIAASLAALAAIVCARRKRPLARAAAWALAAGLLAGAAFGTRYALAPLAAIGVLWLAFGRPVASRAATALAFASGWTAIAAPVMARNRALSGGWLGEARNPSAETVSDVLSGAFARTFGRLPAPALAALALALLALVVTLARDRALRERAWTVLAAEDGIVPAWIALYAGGVMLLRSRVQFDAVGFRLLAPALAASVPLAAGVLVAAFRPPRRVLELAVALCLAVTAANVGIRMARTPPPDDAARIASSPALRWLAESTEPGDPFIAEDGVDLAWMLRDPVLGSRRFASFSPAPYMLPLTAEDLSRFGARHVLPGGAPLRLLVRKREVTAAEWRARYGELLAVAMAGGGQSAGLVLEADLSDARIFRWQPPATRCRRV